jgi:hypothetical protein
VGLLDEAFAGGIRMIAEDMRRSEEYIVDLMFEKIHEGVGNFSIVAEIITTARSRWIEKNKNAE